VTRSSHRRDAAEEAADNEQRQSVPGSLFKQVINLKHELVRVGAEIVTESLVR
jgi:hypothetical protein